MNTMCILTHMMEERSAMFLHAILSDYVARQSG